MRSDAQGDIQCRPGLSLRPDLPEIDFDKAAEGSRGFADYAALVAGQEIATFALVIDGTGETRSLGTKAWNSLWLSHHLSIATCSPILPLFSISDGPSPVVSATNPTIFLKKAPDPLLVDRNLLAWAKDYQLAFGKLIGSPEFSSAVLCLGNAPYLSDPRVQTMLIWSGIEGLLSVESELSRRVGLYCAIMQKGTSDEKAEYFQHVKDAYRLRSRAVHGGKAENSKFVQGYVDAYRILARLLARCIELGRVPAASELDGVAAAQNIT